MSDAVADKIDIAVRVLDRGWRRSWPSAVGRSRGAARAVLEFAPMPSISANHRAVELTIVLADDQAVRRLNRQYRGIDKPTNVLSFGGADRRPGNAVGVPMILGDVILARETVTSEAAAQGKTVSDHATHLVAHGVLHLLGHDHEFAREADAMEAVEIDVLAKLGVPNPYITGRRRRASRLA